MDTNFRSVVQILVLNYFSVMVVQRYHENNYVHIIIMIGVPKLWATKLMGQFLS